MASSPLALPLAFPLSLSLPKAVTLPLPFHLCCHPVADLLPTLFLNYCNHLSLPHSPAPQNQPTSCCRITYFVSLIFENYRGWWTKCKALSPNSQRCLGKTRPSILALVHSPPHMYTSPYIAHLRETSRSSSKMIRLPISYRSLCPPCPPTLSAYYYLWHSKSPPKFRSSHRLHEDFSFAHNVWLFHSLICFSRGFASPLGHFNSILHYSHLHALYYGLCIFRTAICLYYLCSIQHLEDCPKHIYSDVLNK